MKIAFDCAGTLLGDKGLALAKAIKTLQGMGHTCIIWSNSYGYTIQAKQKYDLDCELDTKKSKSDFKEWGQELYDIAIDDDRSQTYLGAKKMVFVDQFNDDNFENIVNTILNDGKEF